jgi:hypothetical protein
VPKTLESLFVAQDLLRAGARQQHEQRGELDQPAAAHDGVDPPREQRRRAQQHDHVGVRHAREATSGRPAPARRGPPDEPGLGVPR